MRKTKNLRIAAAVGSALLGVMSSPAGAVTASPQATATAKIYKPLTIAATQSLDFGIVVLSGSAFTGESVAMSTAGAITCGTTAGDLTCSGSPKPAIYHLTGTANANVAISAPSFNMANGAATLPFTPTFSSTVQLSAAGVLDVNIGGTISGLSNTTTDGTYTGTFLVTANYQ